MSELKLTNPAQKSQIKAAVRKFFSDGGVRLVYADPKSTNWKMGVYGENRVNPLLQRDVVKAIEGLVSMRNWCGKPDMTERVTNSVLGDMRYEKPSRRDFWLD